MVGPLAAFLSARSCKNASKADVAFVTGDLVDPSLGPP
jgi:hypothetical protein